MKRPPQSWILPILGILLFLHSSNCLRATSLIFAKTTTTTTTTESPSSDEEAVTTSSETSASESNQTATRPPLTGIPQIDYIWDPNLPRELNGFNLTDYPFYESLPKDIDFKCDGLHDGFYASVPHKCQVYHHCLFGTRYDFLCANFTAFDQKTFICHFVSEVDCINSPKYWHRNDALYKAATTTTTTTLAPVTQRPVVTPPPPRRQPPPTRRRRPLRRRRPQYEYYDEYDDEYDTAERDDYYDEPRYQITERPRDSGRRRKRPRPVHRRPEYDEYDEYEDERFDRRGSGRRDEDRQRDRRPSKKDNRRDEDPKYEDDDRVERRRPDKKYDDRRRPYDDDDYERRPYNRKSTRRPAVDDDRYDDRQYDRRKDDDERRYRPDDKDDRRPFRKTEEDDRRYRPKEEEKRFTKETKPDDTKGLIRPKSGVSVYDRPRAPPIIRRPVPLNERDKYDYKPTTVKPTNPAVEEEEYYDDYEEEPPKIAPPKTTKKPDPEPAENERRPSFRPGNKRVQNRPFRPTEDVEESRRPQKEADETRRVKEDYVKPKEEDVRRRPIIEDRKPIEDKRKEDIRRPIKEDTGRLTTIQENRRPIQEDIRRPIQENNRRPIQEDIRKPTQEENRKPIQEDYRKIFKRPSEEEPRRSNKRPDDLDDRRKRPLDNPDVTRSQKRPAEDIEDLKRPQKRPHEESEERRFPKRPDRNRYENERVVSKKQKVEEEPIYEDDYEEEKSKEVESQEDRFKSVEEPPPLFRSKFLPKERTTEKVEITTKEFVRPEPKVRVVKRPFLPSRGGNPYASRGLQPIGAKAIDISADKSELNDSPKSADVSKEQNVSKSRPSSEEYEDDPELEPLPLKKDEPSLEDIFNKPVTSRPRTDFRPNFRSESPFRSTAEPKTTTQKPQKQADNYRNPLDINENEYDVTLNDALNPTIPNLPIRSVPTGFGSGREGYVSPNYQRPRFIAIESPLTSASSDQYIQYQIKQDHHGSRLQAASSNPTYAYIRPITYQGQNYRHPSIQQYYTNF